MKIFLILLAFTLPLSASADESSEVFGDAEGELVDLDGFGAPAPPREYPERGQIVLPALEMAFTEESHWQQWDGEIDAQRWGQYRVELVYRLKRAGLGIQIKFGPEFRVKGMIKRSPDDDSTARVELGTAYLPNEGTYPVTMLAPPEDRFTGFAPVEIRLIPGPEGNPASRQEDGSYVLLAKNATTFSEKMRFEPQPEKDCLGFWTEVDDFAEWEFRAEEVGSYEVVIHQGCGEGQGGSEVAVGLGEQELMFTVKDTAGFQNWEAINIGQLEITEAGVQRLTVKPQTKAAKAVLDIQKIELKPVALP